MTESSFNPGFRYHREFARAQKEGEIKSIARLYRLGILRAFYVIPKHMLPDDPLAVSIIIQLLELLWWPLLVARGSQGLRGFVAGGLEALFEWLNRCRSFGGHLSVTDDLPVCFGGKRYVQGCASALGKKAQEVILYVQSQEARVPDGETDSLVLHGSLLKEFKDLIFQTMQGWLALPAMAILTREIDRCNEELYEIRELVEESMVPSGHA